MGHLSRLVRIFGKQGKVELVIVEGDARRGLMVACRNEAAFGGCGRDSFELCAHDVFTLVHGHLVEVPDESHLGVFFAQSGDIHTGLTFQRKNALQPGDSNQLAGVDMSPSESMIARVPTSRIFGSSVS